MANEWIYAKFTKEMADKGGPEAWLEAIKRAEYNRGVSDTKNKIGIPLAFGSAFIGMICVIGYQKIKTRISEKREEKLLVEQKAVEAEKNIRKELAVTLDVSNEYDTKNDLEE